MWKRIEDGYQAGRATITDNGGGMGPSKDSGRWAVSIDGKWLANVDTLAEAKRLATTRHLHIRSYWSRCEICGQQGFYNAP